MCDNILGVEEGGRVGDGRRGKGRRRGRGDREGGEERGGGSRETEGMEGGREGGEHYL